MLEILKLINFENVVWADLLAGCAAGASWCQLRKAEAVGVRLLRHCQYRYWTGGYAKLTTLATIGCDHQYASSLSGRRHSHLISSSTGAERADTAAAPASSACSFVLICFCR